MLIFFDREGQKANNTAILLTVTGEMMKLRNLSARKKNFNSIFSFSYGGIRAICLISKNYLGNQATCSYVTPYHILYLYIIYFFIPFLTPVYVLVFNIN